MIQWWHGPNNTPVRLEMVRRTDWWVFRFCGISRSWDMPINVLEQKIPGNQFKTTTTMLQFYIFLLWQLCMLCLTRKFQTRIYIASNITCMLCLNRLCQTGIKLWIFHGGLCLQFYLSSFSDISQAHFERWILVFWGGWVEWGKGEVPLRLLMPNMKVWYFCGKKGGGCAPPLILIWSAINCFFLL